MMYLVRIMVDVREHNSLQFWQLVNEAKNSKPTQAIARDWRGRRIDCQRFYQLINEAVAGLYRIGLRPGSKVVWSLPNAIETMVILAALDRLGVVQCPLPLTTGAEQLNSVCQQQQPEMLLLPSVWRDIDFSSIAADIQLTLQDMWVVYIDDECLPSGSSTPVWRDEEAFKGAWVFHNPNKEMEKTESLLTIDDLLSLGVSQLASSGAEVTSLELTTMLSEQAGVSALLAMITEGVECVLVEP